MGRVAVLVILSCCVLLLVDRVRCTRYLSKDEDVSVDLKLKLFTTDTQVPATPLFLPNETFPLRKGHALEANQQANPSRPNEFLAVAQTKIGGYAGGGGYVKINNPKVVGHQYSSAFLRLHGGQDSIAVGWRVDPALYGDSQPRFFIHTDAGQSHNCFGTRCPGFVLIDRTFNLEYALPKISQPGGEIWTLACHIIRNSANGNWNLLLGLKRSVVGYWPSSIFTGLKGLADYVEWGGAVYSPPGTPLPPMGSGTFPTGNVNLDGVVAKIEVLNDKAVPTDKFDIVTYATDPKLYSVRDGGEYTNMDHVILFGGPGH